MCTWEGYTLLSRNRRRKCPTSRHNYAYSNTVSDKHSKTIIIIITRSSAVAVIADRIACSILTLFIVSTTSRPLNKKIRLLSVRGSNNYCGSASAICSPHTSAAPAVAPCNRSRHRVIVDKRAVPFRLPA